MLAACTSADEKARRREQAMIERAKEDAAAESEFAQDSIKLAASITVDTVRSVRTREQQSPDDGNYRETVYEAVSPMGQVCLLTAEKYRLIVVGDTLSCQWAAP